MAASATVQGHFTRKPPNAASSALAHLPEFLQSTTFHGLAELDRLRYASLKVFWGLCLIAAYAFCIYETSVSITLFNSGELETTTEEGSLDFLPNMTICTTVEYTTKAKNTWVNIAGDAMNLAEIVKAELERRLSVEEVFSDVLRKSCKHNPPPIASHETTQSLKEEIEQTYPPTGVNSMSYEEMLENVSVKESSQFTSYRAHKTSLLVSFRRSHAYPHGPRDPLLSKWLRCITTFERNRRRAADTFFVLVDQYKRYVVLLQNEIVVDFEHTAGAKVGQIHVQIHQRKRITSCSRFSRHAQIWKGVQCANDAFHKYANCCFCGHGLHCTSPVRCCQKKHKTLFPQMESACLELLPCYKADVVPPCDDTTLTTITTWEGIGSSRDSKTQIIVIFENMKYLTRLRERYRYDAGYILGRVGGTLGLMIGGSLLSFAQIPIFFINKLGCRKSKVMSLGGGYRY